MTNFLSAFNQLAPLTPEAARDLDQRLRGACYEKTDLLLRKGEVCRKLFFIQNGLIKTFFTEEHKEFIMRFFAENSLATVIDSFAYARPSDYSIQALEPTTVAYLLMEDLEDLCQQHHCVETAYRRLVTFATTMMMRRISEMLEEDATARYNNFLRDQAPLMQRISLGDLSNYLGITLVSLSRIRAKK